MIRRLAFFIGLLLGLASTILVSAAILVYVLTGKLAAVEVRETVTGHRPVFKLVSADDFLEMVKKWAAPARQTLAGLEREASDAG